MSKINTTLKLAEVISKATELKLTILVSGETGTFSLTPWKGNSLIAGMFDTEIFITESLKELNKFLDEYLEEEHLNIKHCQTCNEKDCKERRGSLAKEPIKEPSTKNHTAAGVFHSPAEAMEWLAEQVAERLPKTK